jgi:uncharacterized membrane protein YdcZ (DUF606 family)
MLSILIAIPIFAALAIVQSAILSQVNLLLGRVDLVLLVVLSWAIQEKVRTAWQWALIAGVFASLATSLPFLTMPVIYLAVTGFAILIRSRLWRTPLLSMLVSTFVGTFVVYIISYAAAALMNGFLLPVGQAINLALIPGLLLNMFFALPVYAIVRDLADWLVPDELEV